jgi:hypothetical protein
MKISTKARRNAEADRPQPSRISVTIATLIGKPPPRSARPRSKPPCRIGRATPPG